MAAYPVRKVAAYPYRMVRSDSASRVCRRETSRTCDQAFFFKSGRVVKTKWYERAQRVSKLIAFLHEKIKFSIVKPPSNFHFTISTKVLTIFLSHSQHKL